MSVREDLALIELMNSFDDQATLRSFSDSLTGGVIPLHRKTHDTLVATVVKLLVAGASEDQAVEAIITTAKSNTNREQVRNILEGVKTAVKEISQRSTLPDPDARRDYNKDERDAQNLIQRMLSPEANLSANVVRISNWVKDQVDQKAKDACDMQPGDEIINIEVSKQDVVTAWVQRSGALLEEVVISTPKNEDSLSLDM